MTEHTMLTGRNILCLSSIDWDFIWQGHQHIMSTLAQQGNRVLFIENTGIRPPSLHDFPRLRKRVLNWWRSTKGFREEQPRLFVYSPLILPFPYSRLARWINRRLLLRALQRWMRAVGFHQPILWTFLPTPLALDLIRELEPEVTIYYCIDDLASSSRQAQKIVRSESALFRTADVVFVTSEKLRRRALQFREDVHLFPFGVDLETFERVRARPNEVPADLLALPRPIVGYVGGIHQWVDQGLIQALAERLPHASIVLVGPPQTDVSTLSRYRNVHLMGMRAHPDVPRYIKGFDIGIIPYRRSAYTDNVYPTKLNEYLAMGLPVVATDLPEIRRFNEQHGSIVTIAPTADQFVEAIQRLARPPLTPDVERRIAVAMENSWPARIAQMSALIQRVSEQRRSATLKWEESLRRLYDNARRRLLRLAIGVSVSYLLIFQSPLVWWAASPLIVSEAPRPADAIVVFAGGVGETGKAGGGGGYQERVKHAVDLYEAGWAPRMIFSSGYTFVFHETRVMHDLAFALGVPPDAILLETQAVNTKENVERVREMLTANGWRRILLVSSPYHMRRATLTFQKLAPAIEVTPTPVPRSQFYTHYIGPSLEQLRALLQEYAAILYYRWKGWI